MGNLLIRRREMLTGDPTLLYYLENHQMQKGDAIDTGVILFPSAGDILDWSIVFDFTTQEAFSNTNGGAGSRPRFFWSFFYKNSKWYGIYCTRSAYNRAYFTLQWMYEWQNTPSNSWPSSSKGRIRGVYTHQKNTNSMDAKIKLLSGATNSYTLTDNNGYVSAPDDSTHLWIGVNEKPEYYIPKTMVNKFCVYSRVLTSSEISNLIGI